MTCKDCIHYDVCIDNHMYKADWNKNYDRVEHVCEDFKEKSRFVELPCKVGDTVYAICDGLISEQKVVGIDIDLVKLSISTECFFYYECDEEEPCICEAEVCKGYYSDYEFGKCIFFTREEAENALEGMVK